MKTLFYFIIAFFLLSLFSTNTYSQNNPVLVKDFTPGPANSDITELITINDIVYLIAPDGANGFQLWKTDGTEAGTQVVKVINPGVTGMYTYIGSLTNVNGVLFFLADDGVHGNELWKTDGTEAGTMLIKDIAPGSQDAFSDFGIDGDYLAVIDDVLYFNAADDGNNFELWRSDGTETGTYLLKDIVPGNDPSRPVLLSNAGGTLYFQIRNANGENEIWKSDGTPGGTVFLKSISYVYSGDFDSDYFFEYNGYVYFSAAEIPYEEELWRTDGTTAGTALFKDLNTGDGSRPHGFYILNNKLLFFAEDDNDDHLFTTDGTVAGTQLLNDKDGNPAVSGNAATITLYSLYTGNKLYYPGKSNGEDVFWITDGTPTGTFKLANAGHDESSYGSAFGDKAVYRLENLSDNCYTFYESDGTPSGTRRIVRLRLAERSFESRYTWQQSNFPGNER
jgi:ELWxxDGT repeat protein